MPGLELAQRIAFGDYINDQVFPVDANEKLGRKCPFHIEEEDIQRKAEKTRRYSRIEATVENSDEFLRTIASWRKDKNLGINEAVMQNLNKRAEAGDLSLFDAMSMLYRSIDGNIKNLFANESLLKPVDGETSLESVLYDPSAVQGGMINALATQFAWTYVTMQKAVGDSVQKLGKIFDNNKKALHSFMKMQFSVFNIMLNEFGIKNFPFLSFHRYDESKFDLLPLGKSSILVPSESAINTVIKKAKEKDAYAEMQGGSTRESPYFMVRDSSVPFACPAAKMSMESVREAGDKSMKSNLASEFMEYLDEVIKEKLLPKLDKLKRG